MYKINRVTSTTIPIALTLLFGYAGVVYAHAFGQRYSLPLPLWLYVTGAALVVAFSFVVIGLFVHRAPGAGSYPRVNLLRSSLGRMLAHRAVLFSFKIISVSLFILLIFTGLLGNQHPLSNLTPTLVWVIWWVGLAYISALVGNIWALINPWMVLFEGAETLYRSIHPKGKLSGYLSYPEGLGVWPGVFLFLIFSWVELVFPGSAKPANLAVMVLAYSVITWTGMFLFGTEQWLRHGEAFSLAFGLLARFSPTEVRVVGSEACESYDHSCRDRDGECINCYACFRRVKMNHREWNLRPYAVGLARNEAVSSSMMVFALLMLSTVTFDGFMATPAWAKIQSALYAFLPEFGGKRIIAIQTLGLVSFPVLFIGIFLMFSIAMAAASGRRLSTKAFAQSFAFTLVPIAIGYHLAHYLAFLLIQGQRVISLASDPFGFGWNLIGTAGYRVNIGALGARFVWFSAVVAIVLGHIIAVYLAHVIALQKLKNRAPALRSQYPMLALMVSYTMISLWIIAQPVVEKGVRAPVASKRPLQALVKIPPDALIPEPGTGILKKVGEGKTASVKIVYKALSSPFHDGTWTAVADLLYPYIFSYRWGVRTSQNDETYDPLIEKSTALIRNRLAGFRVLRVDEVSRGFGQLKLVFQMPVIEVYLNAALGDPQQTASLAPPWSTLPWSVMVLMEEAVIRAKMAFSRKEAVARGVEWLDLARGRNVQSLLAPLVERFARQGYRPEALKGFVTADEARKRWAALKAFYQKHRHFLVTNGPYVLDKWSEGDVALKVFRDLRYPLGVGSFDKYALPTRAYISRIDPRSDGVHVSAEIEKIEKTGRTYTITREPLRSDSLVDIYRIKPVCKYVVLSPDGDVLKSGTARFENDGTFTVNLQKKFKPGLYKIMLSIYVDKNYINPDVRLVLYRVKG